MLEEKNTNFNQEVMRNNYLFLSKWYSNTFDTSSPLKSPLLELDTDIRRGPGVGDSLSLRPLAFGFGRLTLRCWLWMAEQVQESAHPHWWDALLPPGSHPHGVGESVLGGFTGSWTQTRRTSRSGGVCCFCSFSGSCSSFVIPRVFRCVSFTASKGLHRDSFRWPEGEFL